MSNLRPFTMPKWGIEMSEGTVAEWMVAEGEPFARGAVLTLIETDKITNELEAEEPGCFVRLVAQPGETYPVGALIAVLGEPGADQAEIDALVASFKGADVGFAAAGGAAAAAPEPAPAAPAPPAPAAPALDTAKISPAAHAAAVAAGVDLSTITGTGRNGRISLQDVEQAIRPPVSLSLRGSYDLAPQSAAFASPMARRLAAQHGVDLTGLTGTGPRGRISKADVLAAAGISADAAAPDAGPTIIPMSKMRKVIARRLSESKSTIPHFYVRRRVRADRLMALRAKADPKPSINDYLIRACGLALAQVPAVNIQVHGDDIHRFASADIAVAVATDGGLITPVLPGADRKSPAEISNAMADLGARARAGKLRQNEIEGGSFGLSNLGMFGVEQFDAIINPPHGAILAIGAARPEPIDDDGAIRIVPVLHLSLSCDHRAIDGADAGRFMVALAALLENPERL
jgi:pyruvate dehydrogenase E2 component (dihydrolipoamide acetyltransferase)